MFFLSEDEFWALGLDQFNALVRGHNKANSSGDEKQTAGLPKWARG